MKHFFTDKGNSYLTEIARNLAQTISDGKSLPHYSIVHPGSFFFLFEPAMYLHFSLLSQLQIFYTTFISFLKGGLGGICSSQYGGQNSNGPISIGGFPIRYTCWRILVRISNYSKSFSISNNQQ